MSDASSPTPGFPYETRLDILHCPLQRIDVTALAAACTHKWSTRIDLDGSTVALDPGQGFVVPKGVPHRPRAHRRTVILVVETAGIVPTGRK